MRALGRLLFVTLAGCAGPPTKLAVVRTIDVATPAQRSVEAPTAFLARTEAHSAVVQSRPIPLLECKSNPEPTPGTPMRAPSVLAMAQALMQNVHLQATGLIASLVSYRQFFTKFDPENLRTASPPFVHGFPENSTNRGALPILTQYPKPIDSLFVTTRTRGEALVGEVISGQHKPVRESTIPAETLAAVAEGPGERLYTLSTEGDAEYHSPLIRAVEPGNPELFRLRTPEVNSFAHPDTIALDSNGEPGVLRLLSLLPPTRDDPALFFQKRAGVDDTLAPWSKLYAAPCDPEPGYRAIIRVKDWIRLSLNGMQSDFGDLLAVVKWGKQRVCLEAVAGAFFHSHHEDMLVLSAEFGKKPIASVYQPHWDKQYVHPITCVLNAPEHAP